MIGRSRATRFVGRRAAPFERRALLPRVLIASLMRATLIQVGLILLVVEGVFLVEKLNFFLEWGIDRWASWTQIARLVGLTSPEIFDLALPGALLGGFYRVLYRARERNELLVMSSMGLGPRQFFAPTFAFVAVFGAILLLVNGYVAPLARFAYRSAVFDAQYAALRSGGSPGHVDFFVDHTVFNLPDSGGVLVLERPSGGGVRVIRPEKAALSERPRAGDLSLALQNMMSVDLRPYRDPPSGEERAYRLELESNSHVRAFEKDLELEQLLPFTPTDAIPEEMTWGDAAAAMAGDARKAASANHVLLQRIGHGLLCLQTPLFAAFALTLTRRGFEVFALPVGFILSLASDIAFEAVAHLAGASDFGSGLVVALVIAAVSMGLCAMALRRRLAYLLTPAV